MKYRYHVCVSRLLRKERYDNDLTTWTIQNCPVEHNIIIPCKSFVKLISQHYEKTVTDFFM